MADGSQNPGDIHEFSGANRLFRSKAVQFVINKIDDGTFSDFLDDWRWIFTFSKKYKWIIAFYTALGIVSSSLSLVSSVAGKYLLDLVAGYRTDTLVVWILSMVFGSVFSLLLSSLVSRYSVKLSIYVNNDIQACVYDSIMDADWQGLSRYSSGDLLNRFNNDVGTVAGNAVSWLPNVIIAVYTFIATFVVLFYYDHFMALIALISAPFLLLASRFILRKNKEYRTKVLQTNSQLMTFEAETFYNFDTIKSFGVGGHFSREMRGWQEKYKKVNLDYNLFSIKTNIFTSSLGTGVTFIAFGYCLFRLWTNSITYGTMLLFLSRQSSLSGSFTSLVGILPGMLNSSVSAHRIREIVQLPREVHQKETSAAMAWELKEASAVRAGTAKEASAVRAGAAKEASAVRAGTAKEASAVRAGTAKEASAVRVGTAKEAALPVTEAEKQGLRVSITGVTFSYVEEQRILENSDFVAGPGEIVALVGPSGEGKTTMIRLILGLIRPEEGDVSLVDTEGRQVEINADTRRYFAYVPQGNTLLSGTVAENLRIAKEDATDEEIEEALKTACAWEFVSRLEGGIHGKLGERGRGVSEGQSQRISIARALLRDAPVLLLDEATSALDMETERQVLRNILRERPNKTCIIATHRPSVLGMCRRVYRVVDHRVTQLDKKEAQRFVMDF